MPPPPPHRLLWPRLRIRELPTRPTRTQSKFYAPLIRQCHATVAGHTDLGESDRIRLGASRGREGADTCVPANHDRRGNHLPDHAGCAETQPRDRNQLGVEVTATLQELIADVILSVLQKQFEPLVLLRVEHAGHTRGNIISRHKHHATPLWFSCSWLRSLPRP